ncbi:MAG: solute:sodium symporter family transporter [Pseudomonadales bacterium]|nr:solute:sodium symporter family transporter [Pseudomonadales bacterium]
MSLTYVFRDLAVCAFFMVLVAWISYLKTRGETSTRDGYFLAGRGLTGIFIAGSMLLTNLSAEQLIGLNGSAFGFNLSAMAWEVTAGFATIVMALVFLPRYLAGAFSTLPEFLSKRFDDDVRRMTAILFMVGYGLITIPGVLYAGSIAVLRFFDIPALLGVSYETGLIFTIVLIGVIGALYAILGGLKAVAVSDTINGIGLLIIGILVPILGLRMLGEGNIGGGLEIVLTEHTEKLNAIGAASDPVPWGTIFTGMILANLFYWGTNQYVIQRTLSASNLAEGQKGVLFAGYLKLLVPFVMMLPGIIAFHLYQDDSLRSIDLAYPQLVRDVLPTFMAGFFLAVLLGAVFSSFNSLLNSAATLFCLDLYAPLVKRTLSDAELIRMARVASIVIALVSFIIAPMLMLAPEGLWQVIRVFTGFYNIPVITLVLVGLFTRRVPASAAKVVIGFHIVAYALLQFVFAVPLHFIHLYAVLFAIEVAIMLWMGYRTPAAERQHYVPLVQVDLTPWRYALPMTSTLICLIVLSYLLFSPIGLVGGLSVWFWPLVSVTVLVNMMVCRYFLRRQRPV